MFLKSNANLEDFFGQVRKCSGDVVFESAEGDILNLKSSLCLFLFTTAYLSKGEISLAGDIVCKNPADEVLLAEFLE